MTPEMLDLKYQNLTLTIIFAVLIAVLLYVFSSLVVYFMTRIFKFQDPSFKKANILTFLTLGIFLLNVYVFNYLLHIFDLSFNGMLIYILVTALVGFFLALLIYRESLTETFMIWVLIMFIVVSINWLSYIGIKLVYKDYLPSILDFINRFAI